MLGWDGRPGSQQAPSLPSSQMSTSAPWICLRTWPSGNALQTERRSGSERSPQHSGTLPELGAGRVVASNPPCKTRRRRLWHFRRAILGSTTARLAVTPCGMFQNGQLPSRPARHLPRLGQGQPGRASRRDHVDAGPRTGWALSGRPLWSSGATEAPGVHASLAPILTRGAWMEGPRTMLRPLPDGCPRPYAQV